MCDKEIVLIDEATTSENDRSKPKRKRRTKEEIEERRKLLEEKKVQRDEERRRKKEQKIFEKEFSKLEREIRSAKNSKCEQNLFCDIGPQLYAKFRGLREGVVQKFTERQILGQLLSDSSSDYLITWKRRVIEANCENNRLVRVEKKLLEPYCALCIEGLTFQEFVEKGTLQRFIENSVSSFEIFMRTTVIIFGHHSVRSSKLNETVMDVFERSRTQLRFVSSIDEFAMLLAYMHRSIARCEKMQEKIDQIVVDSNKGIKNGDDLVKDWWMRMLGFVNRIGDDQRRAIVDRFKSPFVLMKELENLDASAGLNLIANLTTDTNRKVGPAIAQKIYLMYRSVSGAEVIEDS
ncbi:hypothetical protein AB6A40_003929 [Gnathostoma spinigerum]|uniref:Uncharacterized protein n=1 Tax=Gnathostoma spinigerum TaxID=75299 RepID=A0ABD6ELR1_9BILA